MYSKMVEETNELVDKIKKSPVYIEYLNYKMLLDNKESLRRAVDDYRRKSFEIQAAHRYGYYNAYENLVRLKEEYEDVLGDPIVNAYLNAEINLSKMINTIFHTIAEGIDFDVDFLG